MAIINSQFLKVFNDGIQSQIDKKVNQFQAVHRDIKLIKLDSGDIVRPLAPCVMEAMTRAIAEMGNEQTFKGRGPAEGYPFLIDAIIKYNFKSYKVKIDPDEVFINHGTKQDVAGFGDILCRDNRIAVIDPVSQDYIESNVIGNRAGELNENNQWSHIIYLECKKKNDFMPEFTKLRPDVIYLSYPNNPTGCVMTREVLEKWVKYAIENDVLILFDATYKSFISDPAIPQTIYEIKGAKKVAIEFRSFSKTAGFTGTRCAYTVVPKALMGYTKSGEKVSLNKLWNRRHTTKFNGVPYIIQRAAEACYSVEGKKQVKETIGYYLNNAKIIREGLSVQGLKVYGGINSPYIWVKTPNDMTSWGFFDYLLNELNVVGTPGVGFGPSGEGYLRLTAFGTLENTKEAVSRLRKISI